MNSGNPDTCYTDLPSFLKRENVEQMLAHLSSEIGATLQLDDNESVSFTYYDGEEATLTFLPQAGLLVLAAPVADPGQISLTRLRFLLEMNMEWDNPCTILTPDNDARTHLCAILPVDPQEPASLEFWLLQMLRIAGEISCAANSPEIRTPTEPVIQAMA